MAAEAIRRVAAFFWRLAVLTVALAQAGCAGPAPLAVRARAPDLLLRLPPSALGRDLALRQHLQVEVGGRMIEFDALLEADATELNLALLVFERPLARLHWDGSTLQSDRQPGWPAAVSAERVLSDLGLLLWPAAAVAAALPPGWTLSADASQRELRWQGEPVERVTYRSPSQVLIEHRLDGYRMTIESIDLLNAGQGRDGE
jgi:hypothetical protein